MAAVDAYHLGEPDDPGHQTHLFLDDFSIEDRWDAERVQNEPVKHPRNPVVLADLPWEVSVNAPSVLYDDEAGLFRMWYSLPSNAAWTRESTGLARKPGEYGPYVMSYAESEDGVTWHKPLFDRFPFAEWSRTNIVYTGVGGGKGRVAGFVVKASPEPLARYGRFMCSYKDDRFDRRFQQEDLNDYLAAGHTCLAFSDDGVAWRPYEGNPLCPCLDTIQDLHWDERLGLYVLASARPFARAATEDLYRELGGAIRGGQALSLTRGAVGSGGTLAGIGRAGGVENVRTRIAVTLSPDLKTWHPPREVLIPDAADDAEQMFFDHMTMDRCGDQYVGFLSVAARDGDRAGRLELTGSPDGIRWHRPRDRKPLLTPGEAGDWDGGHVWSIKNAVPYGEWLYLYYAGSSRPWRYRYPGQHPRHRAGPHPARPLRRLLRRRRRRPPDQPRDQGHRPAAPGELLGAAPRLQPRVARLPAHRAGGADRPRHRRLHLRRLRSQPHGRHRRPPHVARQERLGADGAQPLHPLLHAQHVRVRLPVRPGVVRGLRYRDGVFARLSAIRRRTPGEGVSVRRTSTYFDELIRRSFREEGRPDEKGT